MADSLQELLMQYLPSTGKDESSESIEASNKYLSRLLSLRLSDLSTTEAQSLSQASQSNLLSLQALSSRTHKATIISSDNLSTLRSSLPILSESVESIRTAIPQLDEAAVDFASSYSRSKDDNAALNKRKESMLLATQADKLQDILELPSLLSTAIASAGSGSAGSANYSQALDLFAHIKRLEILYPDSNVVKSVLADAELAMKDMTANLITSLRGQNIRLASAIRTIGWLRRVAPELSTSLSNTSSGVPTQPSTQEEGHFGALFLCARLCTFLTMTEALAPLRDLADQESRKRVDGHEPIADQSKRPSTTSYAVQGQQTERYLKRYIEIFREQSFSTISMFRNIFPQHEEMDESTEDALQLPSALATFPLHLVEMFMETLSTYLPNVTDPAARESLLMQVLYAGNSLGRLGADFSMMISFLQDYPTAEANGKNAQDEEQHEQPIDEDVSQESEWVRVIKKHRVQAARLEAMAADQDQSVTRRGSGDVAVR